MSQFGRAPLEGAGHEGQAKGATDVPEIIEQLQRSSPNRAAAYFDPGWARCSFRCVGLGECGLSGQRTHDDKDKYLPTGRGCSYPPREHGALCRAPPATPCCGTRRVQADYLYEARFPDSSQGNIVVRPGAGTGRHE